MAGEELEKLRGDNSGDLDPAAVVEAARKRTSPLHSAFEWNDSKAATAHRLQQAGRLISALIVTVVNEQGTTVAESISVNVKRGRSARGEGATTAHVFSAEELSAQRLKKGWSELEQWLSTYGGLPEFTTLSTVVGGFLAARNEARKKKVA